MVSTHYCPLSQVGVLLSYQCEQMDFSKKESKGDSRRMALVEREGHCVSGAGVFRPLGLWLRSPAERTPTHAGAWNSWVPHGGGGRGAAGRQCPAELGGQGRMMGRQRAFK